MEISTKIKELRKENKLSQNELGKSVFVSQEMIHSIENGFKVPSVALLARIADVFAVSTDFLIGREGEKQQ